MDYQMIINEMLERVAPLVGVGEQATYIPALANVEPDQMGVCIETVQGEVYSGGRAETRFSIQSISKVFTLAMAFALEGEGLWRRMGREPSGTAFNSLVQLEMERGKPRNPFINAGAIVVADVLCQHLTDPEGTFLHFLRELTGNSQLNYNVTVADSERATGYLNAAIINLLKYYGNIHGDIERVLRFYFLTCSVEMSCRELAHAFVPLADHTRPFDHAGVKLTRSQVKRMNAIMQTCGFYDEAGEFSYLVGLPGKSGVGGGIAALFPGVYAVAVWSPRLNDKGNSVIGMKMLELLTTESEESIF